MYPYESTNNVSSAIQNGQEGITTRIMYDMDPNAVPEHSRTQEQESTNVNEENLERSNQPVDSSILGGIGNLNLDQNSYTQEGASSAAKSTESIQTSIQSQTVATPTPMPLVQPIHYPPIRYFYLMDPTTGIYYATPKDDGMFPHVQSPMHPPYDPQRAENVSQGTTNQNAEMNQILTPQVIQLPTSTPPPLMAYTPQPMPSQVSAPTHPNPYFPTGMPPIPVQPMSPKELGTAELPVCPGIPIPTPQAVPMMIPNLQTPIHTPYYPHMDMSAETTPLHSGQATPMGLSPSSLTALSALPSPEASSASSDNQEFQHSRTNVYIRGLPPNTTDESLFRIGRGYGKIVSSKSIIDPRTNLCKGYGFVMYEREEDAKAAVEMLGRQGFQSSFAKKESFSTKLKNLQDVCSTNVYLSNLPLDMTEQSLAEMIRPYKTVSTKVLRDHRGLSRGVGFARMCDRESALAVISKFNNVTLHGATSPLQVRFADTIAVKRLKGQSAKKRMYYNLRPTPPGGSPHVVGMMGLGMMTPPSDRSWRYSGSGGSPLRPRSFENEPHEFQAKVEPLKEEEPDVI